MKITEIKSHVLQYDLDKPLGYSQQYFTKRTAHIVEVCTDEGITGWGECFGAGNVAFANKAIVERVIQPMVLGMDPLDRDVIWHKVYNLLRDHGQKGMAVQSLSGVDIALWDIAGKAYNQPIHKLIGGASRQRLNVYGYAMMLQQVDDLPAIFAEEAAEIERKGFTATKMKIGLGIKDDIALVEAVRGAVSADMQVFVDANHCYTATEAFQVGRAMEDMDIGWFEEPVAPEDVDGYKRLTDGLKLPIAGGECEFTRWGWRHLLERRCLDIAQPEVCALGGISEYLRVVALAHTHFTPVVNHVWGSAISVATNMHLLAWLPDLPGGAHPVQPLLEFDTTPNLFRDELITEPLQIQAQVKESGGSVAIPNGPGLGIEVDRDFLARFEVT